MPVRLLNSLFLSSNNFTNIDQELASLVLLIPNIYSIFLFSLMASKNWKIASELYLKVFLNIFFK
jgi:hypothetical protein